VSHDETGDQSAAAEEIWTIVVAAGSGRRFGGLKQYERLGSGGGHRASTAPAGAVDGLMRVIDVAVGTAVAASDGVVVVLPADDVAGHRNVWHSERGAAVAVVAGGSTRSESVRAGLAAVPSSATVIMVHDGARPFASPGLFASVVASVRAGADGVVPGVVVADTIKQIDDAGRVVATPDRASLRAVQTPQGFAAGALRAAHASNAEATDDAGLIEAAGGRVVVIDGEVGNRKITTPDDLAWARTQWAEREAAG
jgi:2-C-methyl-D-erythritol 4-phosphate cytidylyltransferase